MSLSKLIPTTEMLNQALMKARGVTPVNGSLWTQLLESLQIEQDGLQRLLQDAHGVASLSDENILQATVLQGRQRINADTNSEYVMLSHRGQVLLLTEDPWHSDATLLLSRSSVVGTVLTVARPQQMASFTQHADAKKTSVSGKQSETSGDSLSSPVVAFVDQAIAKAYKDGASDIHFETGRHRIEVKYRLDGVMAAGSKMEIPVIAEDPSPRPGFPRYVLVDGRRAQARLRGIQSCRARSHGRRNPSPRFTVQPHLP